MLPQAQDDFLDAGYFRAGHTIRRTRFVFVDRRVYSTIWSRVPLRTFAFRKRQRKLLRRARETFATTIEPYTPRLDQDIVYERYQQAHPLEVGATIAEVLGGHEPTHEFRTHILRVEREGELVGFSLFDVGDTTLASIVGCYLPEYAPHSIGYFSMLAELEHGRERGLTYYHPGYCVPGLDAFAYKLRLPDLEGHNYTMDDWRPMAEVLAATPPHVRMGEHLEVLSAVLDERGIPHHRVTLPLGETFPSDNLSFGPLSHPMGLHLDHALPVGSVYVAYELEHQRYEAWFVEPVGTLADTPELAGYRAELPPDSDLTYFDLRVPLLFGRRVGAVASHLELERLQLYLMKVLL